MTAPEIHFEVHEFYIVTHVNTLNRPDQTRTKTSHTVIFNDKQPTAH